MATVHVSSRARRLTSVRHGGPAFDPYGEPVPQTSLMGIHAGRSSTGANDTTTRSGPARKGDFDDANRLRGWIRHDGTNVPVFHG